jgi:hypothetical protein
MRAFNFQIKGLEAVKKKVGGLSKETIQKVDGAIAATVADINAEQMRAAPADRGGGGGLRAGIDKQRLAPMSYIMFSQMPYSAYVEWGTGGLVDVPAGLEDYAIQFKGKGIKQVNLPARPFFFTPFLREKEALKKRIESLINKI